MTKKKFLLCILFLFIFAGPLLAIEYSDTARLMQGFGEIVAAPFYTPYEVLSKSLTEIPPVGTIHGAAVGVYRTVSTLMRGIFDIAGAAAPYAAYALPFL